MFTILNLLDLDPGSVEADHASFKRISAKLKCFTIIPRGLPERIQKPTLPNKQGHLKSQISQLSSKAFLGRPTRVSLSVR